MATPANHVELTAKVAVLEAQQAELREDIKELKDNEKDISEKLDQLLEAHTKYKGFVGGIMLMVSVVSSAIGIAVAVFKSKFLGG